jgi:hypothetical protein
MAATEDKRKFVVVRPYTRVVNGKTIKVEKHVRSTPCPKSA